MLSSHLRSARRTAALAAAALGIAGVLSSAPAAHADTVSVPWSTFLPGWTDTYVPTSANDCVAGRKTCVTQTTKELNRVLTDTGKGCSHHAVFALAYTRMTQGYQWSRELPGYYDDVTFANHQDAVFAKYYTDAWTAWRRGDRAAVPEAWRIAFDTSASGSVTGTGDLLLGMNAHINRDLPFVLASVGLVAPDGSSRKPDYDKVEEWLAATAKPLIEEASQRFDPTMDDTADPYDLGYSGTVQVVSAWREQAWREAEALVSAPTPEARALVAAGIEAYATATAQAIRLATQQPAPLLGTSLLGSATSRDDYCAVHNGDTAPLAYPFGTASPYRT